MDFHDDFQDKSNMAQGTIWNILWMFWNTWIRTFLHFSGGIHRETYKQIFMKFSELVGHGTRNNWQH